jgi:hypothetical protein
MLNNFAVIIKLIKIIIIYIMMVITLQIYIKLTYEYKGNFIHKNIFALIIILYSYLIFKVIEIKDKYNNAIISKYNYIEYKKYKKYKQMECCICLDRKSNTIIKPCEHYQFCIDCIYKCELCPLCRQKIYLVNIIKK